MKAADDEAYGQMRVVAPFPCLRNTSRRPAASVGDPLRYPVLLPAYIEEDATVIEKSMEAINDIADLIATHGENTTLAELPQLLADLTNIAIVLKGHVDNLRGVFFKMRNYSI
jgi:hypothetical protein